MARGITIPIQQLAEGTRRIAGGDLDFKLGVEAQDEIGSLVESFNRMTKDLNDSQHKIRSVNQNLKTTNIELERRRQYIETILVNIGAGVISVNKMGLVTTFNKAAENILKVKASNFLGSSYKNTFNTPHQDLIRKMIQHLTKYTREGQTLLSTSPTKRIPKCDVPRLGFRARYPRHCYTLTNDRVSPRVSKGRIIECINGHIYHHWPLCLYLYRL